MVTRKEAFLIRKASFLVIIVLICFVNRKIKELRTTKAQCINNPLCTLCLCGSIRFIC